MSTNRKTPLIFGSERCQGLLLEAYERGETTNNQEDALLYGSGLAYRFKRNGRTYAALDERHPAFDLLLSVLGELSGKPRGRRPTEEPGAPHVIEPRYPLCHFAKHDFRVIQRVVEAGAGGLDLANLRRRLPDVWPTSLPAIVARLVRNRVLRTGAGSSDLSNANLNSLELSLHSRKGGAQRIHCPTSRRT